MVVKMRIDSILPWYILQGHNDLCHGPDHQSRSDNQAPEGDEIIIFSKKIA